MGDSPLAAEFSHIGTDFFPDQAAMAEAVAVYERASEPIWARSRDQILGFFDGFELLGRAWSPSDNGVRSPARLPPTRRVRPLGC